MKRRPFSLSLPFRSLGLSLAMAFVASCGGAAPPPAAPPPAAPREASASLVPSGDPVCRYTQASDAHVQPRHCATNTFQEKSKFNNATTACNGLQGGQNFCRAVQEGYSNRRVQAGGRICYDKNFGQTIGTQGGANQSWGRVVIAPGDGTVVTQFSEFGPGC